MVKSVSKDVEDSMFLFTHETSTTQVKTYFYIMRAESLRTGFFVSESVRLIRADTISAYSIRIEGASATLTLLQILRNVFSAVCPNFNLGVILRVLSILRTKLMPQFQSCEE